MHLNLVGLCTSKVGDLRDARGTRCVQRACCEASANLPSSTATLKTPPARVVGIHQSLSTLHLQHSIRVISGLPSNEAALRMVFGRELDIHNIEQQLLSRQGCVCIAHASPDAVDVLSYDAPAPRPTPGQTILDF